MKNLQIRARWLVDLVFDISHSKTLEILEEKKLRMHISFSMCMKLFGKKNGFTGMADGWIDQRRRRRTILNFLVKSLKRTFFFKSIDACGISKTVDKILKITEDVFDEVGDKNVVRIVTDNAENYKLVG